MQGYKIVFSTVRDRKHDGVSVYEWLIDAAKAIDMQGVTVINASQGYGRDKTMHSAGFFELADQPIEIIMLADEQKCDMLFEKIKSEGLSIFYSKTAAEFGFTL